MLREGFFRLLRVVNMNYSFCRNINNQLYILMFHQVNNNNFKFYPSVPTPVFEQICNFLSRRFNVIYVSEAQDYFKKERKPAFIISFDDGHRDILENAFPILQRYKLKFNINIVTESMETGLPQARVAVYNVLNSTEKEEYVNTELFSQPIKIRIDKISSSKAEAEFSKLFHSLDKIQGRLLVKDIINKLANKSTKFSQMLSREDVLYLYKNGAEVGSHTHSHSILPNIGMPEIEFELVHSKNTLEDLCKTNIDIIAFPQGMCNETVIQKSKEAGYKYLLLTGDRRNVIDGENDNTFYRIGLYHKTLDENLAKTFGFHQAIHSLKKRLRNGR